MNYALAKSSRAVAVYLGLSYYWGDRLERSSISGSGIAEITTVCDARLVYCSWFLSGQSLPSLYESADKWAKRSKGVRNNAYSWLQDRPHSKLGNIQRVGGDLIDVFESY